MTMPKGPRKFIIVDGKKFYLLKRANRKRKIRIPISNGISFYRNRYEVQVWNKTYRQYVGRYRTLEEAKVACSKAYKDVYRDLIHSVELVKDRKTKRNFKVIDKWIEKEDGFYNYIAGPECPVIVVVPSEGYDIVHPNFYLIQTIRRWRLIK